MRYNSNKPLTLLTIKIKTMNTKKVRINIPDEQILKRIATTPALKRLSRLVLKVGDNIETVNHKQFADMVRLYSLINVTVTEIKI